MLNFAKPQKIALALLRGKEKKIRYFSEASDHDKENVKAGAYWLASGVSFYWDSPVVSAADLVLSFWEAYEEGLVGLPADITNIVVREKSDTVSYSSIREIDGTLTFCSYHLIAGKGLGAFVYKCGIHGFKGGGLDLVFTRPPGKICGGSLDEGKAAEGATISILSHLASLSAVGTSLTPATRHSSELLWRDEPLSTHNIVTLPAMNNGGSCGAEFGPRAAPRLHLRRGHIRQLPSGEKTWVRPAWVGHVSQGTVTKEYRVH